MTLLTTEIDPDNSLIVFAADRRISTARRYHDTRKKIFELPWLSAGIGYFGIAEITGTRPMQEWLESFIRHAANYRTLADFANALADALNSVVPANGHTRERSGFHIAGFNDTAEPEFWFVRNVDDAGNLTLGRYVPREDFQRRDAQTLNPGVAAIYRNGDLRAHEVAWRQLDESFGQLLNTPGFRQMRNPRDYVEWVKFKMEQIAYFYKQYYRGSIIARPIDAFGIVGPAGPNPRGRYKIGRASCRERV